MAGASAGTAGPPPDFTPHGTQPGLFFPLDEPQQCQSCHNGFAAPDDGFMPFSTWSGSMMANATRDPLFWAALDVAERDAPGVGDWCLRCHTPRGWSEGRVRKNGTGGYVNGTNGCLLTGDHDDEDNSANDYAGVTCHLCHRMTERGPLGQVAPQPNTGNVWLTDQSCAGFGQPCRYGPYDYASTPDLEPPHPWQFSRFTTGSAMCGTCHDVSSPEVGGTPLKRLILNDGTLTTRAFPAERTFTEWRQSRYGEALLIDSFEADGAPRPASPASVDCQDCHMRGSASADARACIFHQSGARTGQLPVHEFVGGSVWVLRLLKGLYGAFGQLDREAAFDRTIAWSLELLQQRSATIDVTLDAWPGGTAPLAAHVRVTNLSGHKLPTGYAEGRRMWLQIVARDVNGATVFESGGWDPATGNLASDAQLKVYESLQGIWDSGSSTCRTADGMGRKQFHFVLNDCIAKDNRIPPEGFRLASAGDPLGLEYRPVGYSYPETAPGSGILVNYDVTDYTIPIPPGSVPPISVVATLQYQTASKEYLEFLRDEAVENAQPTENAMCGRSWTVGPADKTRGGFIYDLWNSGPQGKSPPVPMVSDTATTP